MGSRDVGFGCCTSIKQQPNGFLRQCGLVSVESAVCARSGHCRQGEGQRGLFENPGHMVGWEGAVAPDRASVTESAEENANSRPWCQNGPGKESPVWGSGDSPERGSNNFSGFVVVASAGQLFERASRHEEKASLHTAVPHSCHRDQRSQIFSEARLSSRMGEQIATQPHTLVATPSDREERSQIFPEPLLWSSNEDRDRDFNLFQFASNEEVRLTIAVTRSVTCKEEMRAQSIACSAQAAKQKRAFALMLLIQKGECSCQQMTIGDLAIVFFVLHRLTRISTECKDTYKYQRRLRAIVKKWLTHEADKQNIGASGCEGQGKLLSRNVVHERDAECGQKHDRSKTKQRRCQKAAKLKAYQELRRAQLAAFTRMLQQVILELDVQAKVLGEGQTCRICGDAIRGIVCHTSTHEDIHWGCAQLHFDGCEEQTLSRSTGDFARCSPEATGADTGACVGSQHEAQNIWDGRRNCGRGNEGRVTLAHPRDPQTIVCKSSSENRKNIGRSSPRREGEKSVNRSEEKPEQIVHRHTNKHQHRCGRASRMRDDRTFIIATANTEMRHTLCANQEDSSIGDSMARRQSHTSERYQITLQLRQTRRQDLHVVHVQSTLNECQDKCVHNAILKCAQRRTERQRWQRALYGLCDNHEQTCSKVPDMRSRNFARLNQFMWYRRLWLQVIEIGDRETFRDNEILISRDFGYRGGRKIGVVLACAKSQHVWLLKRKDGGCIRQIENVVPIGGLPFQTPMGAAHVEPHKDGCVQDNNRAEDDQLRQLQGSRKCRNPCGVVQLWLPSSELHIFFLENLRAETELDTAHARAEILQELEIQTLVRREDDGKDEGFVVRRSIELCEPLTIQNLISLFTHVAQRCHGVDMRERWTENIACLVALAKKELAQDHSEKAIDTRRANVITPNSQYDKLHRSPPVGLRNNDDRCYLHAVLQCLWHCKSFQREAMRILQVRSNPACKDKLSLMHHAMLQDYKNIYVEQCASFAAKEAFYVASQVHHGRQEDAQEFMATCLNGFDADESPLSRLWSGKEQKTFRCSETACRKWQYSLKCGAGEEQNAREQAEKPFRTLQLHVEDENGMMETIRDCIRAYEREEKIEDPDTQFVCAHCASTSLPYQKTSLTTLPELLTVQFRRFVYDHKKSTTRKLGSRVKMDQRITVGTDTFNLRGLIYHGGENASSGHYWAYVRMEDDSWTLCNDSVVRTVEANEIWKPCMGYEKESIYLMFFEKEFIII